MAGGCLALAAFSAVAISAAGHSDTAYTFPLIRLPEFMLGIVLALELRDGWRPAISGWWLALSLAVGAVVATYSPGKIGGYAVVLQAAVLVVWAAGRDLSGRPSLLRSRTAVWLGEVSFAFYLVHSLVLRLMGHELGWNHNLPFIAVLGITLLAFTITLAVSAALHHGVERPMQRAIAGKKRPALNPSVEAVGGDGLS